jgi:hypothetical protein
VRSAGLHCGWSDDAAAHATRAPSAKLSPLIGLSLQNQRKEKEKKKKKRKTKRKKSGEISKTGNWGEKKNH